MQSTWRFFWVLPLIPVAAWIAMSFLLGSLGGWISLARAYRTQEPVWGERFWMKSAKMRYGVAYRGVLNFGVDARGLFISIFPLFRLGHPPLLIPWSDISFTRAEGWLLGAVRLNFRLAPGTPLLLQASVARQIFANAPSPALGGLDLGTGGAAECPSR